MNIIIVISILCLLASAVFSSKFSDEFAIGWIFEIIIITACMIIIMSGRLGLEWAAISGLITGIIISSFTFALLNSSNNWHCHICNQFMLDRKKNKDKYFCSIGCINDHVGYTGPLCDKCRQTCSHKDFARVSWVNGFGTTLIGDEKVCEECGSSIRTVVMIILFIPIIPIQSYRLVKMGNKSFCGKQTTMPMEHKLIFIMPIIAGTIVLVIGKMFFQ